jgi:4-amino-4-deoxy-L-arabinose transferase-like glycosyltransferase
MGPSIGNVKVSVVPGETAHADRWRAAFWSVWAVMLVVRLTLAGGLSPFGDEAWYWQESRALDWSYSDLPPATAGLIRLGEALFGHGVLPMRAPFLLLGALLPLLLVRTGRRVFGEARGWQTGLLGLAMPLSGTLGILALPDVPLTVCSALALDALEKAVRTRRLGAWVVLGLALAGAWLCHYRAAVLLFAGVAFLLVTARGRQLWREPGLWLALGISVAGLLPLLAFNVAHDWAALRFQLIERNPWSFHADALVQPFEQALACTPLFYLLLLWAAWRCARRASEGAPWDWLAVCAVVPITAFFVVGCFADDTRFRVHWPLPGYLPLLIALPKLLAQSSWRRGILVATFALMILGQIAACIYLGIAATANGATALAGIKAFPEHFVGWSEAVSRTRTLLQEPQFRNAVLVADNFMLAAELDFGLDGARTVYVLDHPINAKHGRTAQLHLWGRDEAGLAALGHHDVLLVAEPTARRERERAGWMQSLCTRIAELQPAAVLDLFSGRKRYRWFSGTVPADPSPPSESCPATP